jgi:hypothetical protein
MGRLKLSVQADDARTTKVKRSEVGGLSNYWEIDLAGIVVIIREEAFDDLLRKMKAAKAAEERALAEWREKRAAERATK